LVVKIEVVLQDQEVFLVVKHFLEQMIDTRFLLFITAICIAIVYYILFPLDQIIDIIFDEYITITIMIASIVGYIYFKTKLKGKLLREFIPNTNYIPIKSTILFFLIFEIIDFYMEDGLKGMIKLWFSYWVFGVIAYFVTHNINFYKNIQAYKIFDQSQK